MGNNAGKEHGAGGGGDGSAGGNSSKVTPVDVLEAKLAVDRMKKRQEEVEDRHGEEGGKATANMTLMAASSSSSTSSMRRTQEENAQTTLSTPAPVSPRHGRSAHATSSTLGTSRDAAAPMASDNGAIETATTTRAGEPKQPSSSVPTLIPQGQRTATETTSSILPSIDDMRQRAMLSRVPVAPSETPASTAFVRQFRHATSASSNAAAASGSADTAASAEVVARVEELGAELAAKRVHPSTSRERSVLEKTVLVLRRRINEEKERRVKLDAHISFVYDKAGEDESSDARTCEAMEQEAEKRFRTKLKRSKAHYDGETARLERERAELEELTNATVKQAEEEEKETTSKLEEEIAQIDAELADKLRELVEISERDMAKKRADTEAVLKRAMEARDAQEEAWKSREAQLRQMEEACGAEVKAAEVARTALLKNEALCTSRLEAMRGSIGDSLALACGEEEELQRELEHIGIEREAATRRLGLEKASADAQILEQRATMKQNIEEATRANKAQLDTAMEEVAALVAKADALRVAYDEEENKCAEEVKHSENEVNARRAKLDALKEQVASDRSHLEAQHTQRTDAFEEREKLLSDQVKTARESSDQALQDERARHVSAARARESELQAKKDAINNTASEREEEVQGAENELAALRAEQNAEAAAQREKERLAGALRSLPADIAPRRERAYREALKAHDASMKKATDALERRRASHEAREEELSRRMEGTVRAVEEASRLQAAADAQLNQRMGARISHASAQIEAIEARTAGVHAAASERARKLAEKLAAAKTEIEDIRTNAMKQLGEDGAAPGSSAAQLTASEKITLSARLVQLRVSVLGVKISADTDEPPLGSTANGVGSVLKDLAGADIDDEEDGSGVGIEEEDMDTDNMTRRRCEQLMRTSCDARVVALDATCERMKRSLEREEASATEALAQQEEVLRARRSSLEKSFKSSSDASETASQKHAAMRKELESEHARFAEVQEQRAKELEAVEASFAADVERISEKRAAAERSADASMHAAIRKHLGIGAEVDHGVDITDAEASAKAAQERMVREGSEHEARSRMLRDRIGEAERLLATKRQSRASLALEEASMLESLQSAYRKLEDEAAAEEAARCATVEAEGAKEVGTLEEELAGLRTGVAEESKSHQDAMDALALRLSNAQDELDAFVKSEESRIAALQTECRRIATEREELVSKHTSMQDAATQRYETRLSEIEATSAERSAYLDGQRAEVAGIIEEAGAGVEEALAEHASRENECRARLAEVESKIKEGESELAALEAESVKATDARVAKDAYLESKHVALQRAAGARDVGCQRIAVERKKADTDVADGEEQLRLVDEMVALERESGGGSALKADLVSFACTKRIAAEDTARSIVDAARARVAESTTEYDEGIASLEMRNDAAHRELLAAEESAEMEMEKATFEIAEHRRRASEALASQLISVERASKLAGDKYENDMRQLGSQLERDHKALVAREAMECAQLEQRRDEAMRSALKWLAQHKRSIEDGFAAAKYQRDAVHRRIAQELKDLESNLGKAALLRDKLLSEVDYIQRSKLSSERSRSSDLVVIAEYESKELAALAEDEALLVAEPTLPRLLDEVAPAMAYTATTDVGRRGELLGTVLDARGFDKLKEYGLESHCSTLLTTLRALVRMEASNHDRLARGEATSSQTVASPSSSGANVAPDGEENLEELKLAVQGADAGARGDEQWRAERTESIASLHASQMESLERDREAVSRRCSLRVAAAQAACTKAIERLEAGKVLLMASGGTAAGDMDASTSVSQQREAATKFCSEAVTSLEKKEADVVAKQEALEKELRRHQAQARLEGEKLAAVEVDVSAAEEKLSFAEAEEAKAVAILQDETGKRSKQGGRARLMAAGTSTSSSASPEEIDAMRREVERLSAVTASLRSRVELAREHSTKAGSRYEETQRLVSAAEKARRMGARDAEQLLGTLAGEKTALRERLALDLASIEEEAARKGAEEREERSRALADELAVVDSSIAKEQTNLRAAVDRVKAEASDELTRLQECEKELKAKFDLEQENLKREADRRQKKRRSEQRRAVRALETSRANVELERRDEEERARRQLASLATQVEHEWKLLAEKEAAAMRKLYTSISERRSALAGRVESDRRTLEEGFAMTRWDADQAERAARNKLEVIEERERQSKAAIVTLQMELGELRGREASAAAELNAKLQDAVQEYKRMVGASKRQIASEAKDILNDIQMQALRDGFVVAEKSLDAIVKSMEAAGAYEKKNTKDLDEETEKFEAEKAAAAIELDRIERELRSA